MCSDRMEREDVWATRRAIGKAIGTKRGNYVRVWARRPSNSNATYVVAPDQPKIINCSILKKVVIVKKGSESFGKVV
jgi:hypothetical protein